MVVQHFACSVFKCVLSEKVDPFYKKSGHSILEAMPASSLSCILAAAESGHLDWCFLDILTGRGGTGKTKSSRCDVLAEPRTPWCNIPFSDKGLFGCERRVIKSSLDAYKGIERDKGWFGCPRVGLLPGPFSWSLLVQWTTSIHPILGAQQIRQGSLAVT